MDRPFRRAVSLPLACAAAWLMVAVPLLAQSPREILRRAGAYVVDYGESLASVVGEEHYTQQLIAREGGAVLESRVLRAEIAFVPLAGSREWQAVRNVISVDGQGVSGAAGRLERVLRDPPRAIAAQARIIGEESARFNLGPLRRTFNAPTMPLQFLHPSHQERFRFDRRREDVIAGERAAVMRFRERRRATLIRSPEGQDVPVEGHVWIVPEDGRVLRASFYASDFLPDDPGPRTSRADLETIWRSDERLAMWVPDEMRERYSGPWTREGVAFDITGHAVYSNYRRFEVDIRIGP
jgi:hypothetical protein